MVRWFLAALLAAGAGVCVPRAAAQTDSFSAAPRSAIEAVRADTPFIGTIQVEGLRRVPEQTVRARIGSREGTRLDARQIALDVRELARLGWFGDISVEANPARDGASRTRLIYHVEENPFLTETEFAGSRALSGERILQLLKDRNIAPRLGEPANGAALFGAAAAIREALGELGYPRARVRMERRESENATLHVRYLIDDGPKITISSIRFEGRSGVSGKELLGQMRELRPRAWFAGLGGKNVFAQDRFESDRERLLNYYADHGYPNARIGFAKISARGEEMRRWLPWPHRGRIVRQDVTIPVEAGAFYRLEKVEIAQELQERAKPRRVEAVLLGEDLPGKAYSARNIELLRREWFARVNAKPGKITNAEFRGVDAVRTFAPERHTAAVRLELSKEPPLMVERIEIRGLHKFKDKYVRRRLVLQEGKPFDERALEAGLARLTRTGYFRPIKREDVHVAVNEEKRSADVTVQLHEIGQQRMSLTGGPSSFGSTLGIVYSVFDLLNREELLSGQIEGGPQSAEVALGLLKDGFLGSRGGLALSVFDNVVRPRLSGSVKGPFYAAQSEGINAGWSYTVSAKDAVGVNYAITRNITRYSPDVPEALTGIVPGEIRAKTDSRSLAASWTHDSGNARRIIDGSVSGGWLGGEEHLLRSSAEYGRIVRDPVFDKQNAWAFRIYASGAGSYSGDMPLYARLFPGDELVRGLRAGELGPYAANGALEADGTTKYSAAPAGSNVAAAANLEYRVPLREGLEWAGFFDAGSGLLLPNWLGNSRPTLLAGTNGVLHGATGIQLTWTAPGVHLPVRAYYALNVVRLNRFSELPNGAIFHARNRLSAFGWALGSLF